DRDDVQRIEAALERRTAMAGGTERNTLGRDRRIRRNVVVRRSETSDVDEVASARRFARCTVPDVQGRAAPAILSITTMRSITSPSRTPSTTSIPSTTSPKTV